MVDSLWFIDEYRELFTAYLVLRTVQIEPRVKSHEPRTRD